MRAWFGLGRWCWTYNPTQHGIWTAMDTSRTHHVVEGVREAGKEEEEGDKLAGGHAIVREDELPAVV